MVRPKARVESPTSFFFAELSFKVHFTGVLRICVVTETGHSSYGSGGDQLQQRQVKRSDFISRLASGD